MNGNTWDKDDKANLLLRTPGMIPVIVAALDLRFHYARLTLTSPLEVRLTQHNISLHGLGIQDQRSLYFLRMRNSPVNKEHLRTERIGNQLGAISTEECEFTRPPSKT